MAAPVTSAEMLVLEEYFARSSLGEPTSMEGRILRWEDAWMTVDDVVVRVAHMGSASLVEKGYAETTAANPGSGNNIEFWRPDVGGINYIIIPDSIPSYVFTAANETIPEWAGLAVDCLGQGFFQVIRQSDHNPPSRIRTHLRLRPPGGRQ